MEARTREFPVIPIDGTLVDIRRTFVDLGSSLIRRPLAVPADLPPPHTLARLSEAAGLNEGEAQRVRRLVGIIEDFWMTLAPVESELLPPGVCMRTPIFYVKRVTTRGRSVLLQTISWLEKYGLHNPIVWCEVE